MIPDADELYSQFFDRWYDAGDRERKGFSHTRPDMMAYYRAGLVASDLSRLSDASQAKVLGRIETMLTAARKDWPRYLEVTGELDEDWIRAFDDYYDVDRVASIIRESDPGDFSNDLMVTVCEFGSALGHVLLEMQPRLQWLAEWPYWESSLYDPDSGNVIPPFHWAMKKFSSYGIDDGFAAKLHMCIEVLDRPPKSDR